jgi:hypothetical protein
MGRSISNSDGLSRPAERTWDRAAGLQMGDVL